MILPRFIAPPSASTGSARCSIRSARFEGETPSYPPYNIERVGENEYRISMAVAGFGEDDLTIEVKENTLSIRGEKQAEEEESTFLHRGIAGRSFERKFQLADHVVVKGAGLENGLLHVDLVRELPEAMKPRTIPIATKTRQSPRSSTARPRKRFAHPIDCRRAPSQNRGRPFFVPWRNCLACRGLYDVRQA